MNAKSGQNLLRPPIVVVMGHVNHGKTKLLDHIRKTNVAEKEKGGITQSIGAYEITHAGKKISFLDTPGHEAFSKMRAHGARLADLAILVVAADEGVKPQTEDALKYILREKIPFVVAINKIDKPSANVEKVRQDLGKAGVLLEGMGGSVSWHAVSAKTGEGVNELLDLVALSAEIENLTYNPENPPSGFVLTSHLDSRRGLKVGVVLTDGILKKGQEIFTESAKGKVKILEDSRGNQIEALEPGAPAMILGFETLPQPGDEFSADPKKFKELIRKTRATPETTPQKEDQKIKLILKADEGGSLDALLHVAEKVAGEKGVTVIDKSVGNINEGDVKLAGASGALILGFRVEADKAALNVAKMQNVLIMTADVIYELEKELEKRVKTSLHEPRAVIILAVFGELKNRKQVVGGRIEKGPVRNKEKFQIRRVEEVAGAGRILNLQAQKKDVVSAEEGKEVGILAETDAVIKTGDKLEFAE